MAVEVSKDVRQFSQEHDSEGRQKTAGEVVEKRKVYFDKKVAFEKRIKSLEDEIRAGEIKAQEAIEAVKSLEDELEFRQATVVERLVGFIKIRKLREILGAQSVKSQELIKEVADKKQMLTQLREQGLDKSELEEARVLLREFYAGEQEKLTAYEQDRQVRDVKTVMNSHDVLVIHGIHPNFTPAGNSLLKKDIDWETKLRILLAFEPTVSTSTVRAGDDFSNMWARMGVILNGGSVKSAHFTDAGTVAQSLKSRGNALMRPGTAEEEIRSAVAGRRNGYNELTVEGPQVAGLYYCLDDTGDVSIPDLVAAEEFKKVAEKLELPIFAMQRGELYEGLVEDVAEKVIDRGHGTLEKNPAYSRVAAGRKIEKGEVLAQGARLDGVTKEKMRAELMDVAPFEVKNLERGLVDCKNYGAELFMRLVSKDGWEEGAQPYHRSKKEQPGGIPEGAPAKQVGEIFDTDGKKVTYLMSGKKLFRREENFRTGEVKAEDLEHSYQSNYALHKGGRIELRFRLNLELGSEGPIKDSVDYLKRVNEKLAELEKTIESKDEKDKNFWRGIVKQVCYHMRGFADAAAKSGDSATAQAAMETADKFVPRAEMDEMLERRLDASGKFKITQEDLEGKGE